MTEANWLDATLPAVLTGAICAGGLMLLDWWYFRR